MRSTLLATLALATAIPFARAQSEAAPIPHPAFPSATTTPLATQIASLLSDPKVARAHWGIAVTELDGTPIYGLDEGKLFRPASNAKLFTTAAAMALLGPEATVTTTVEGDMGEDGIVKGDLRLVGHGDANFGADDLPYVSPKLRPKDAPPKTSMRDIDELVDKLKKVGVKEVRGNVVGDDGEFPYQPIVDSWDVGDLIWGYGAPVSALTISDNQMELRVLPGKALSEYPGVLAPAAVGVEQPVVPYYAVDFNVSTTLQGSPTHIEVERTPNHRLRVYGTVSAGAPDVEHISIDEPALYAAMVLRKKLLDVGIKVGGSATASHSAPQLVHDALQPLTACERQSHGMGGNCAESCYVRWTGNVLATHTSPPLAEDVKYTLKVSQNLHAELIARRFARNGNCSDASSETASRLIREFLHQRAAIDPADLFLYDGSGLSGHDLITPRSAAQLLTYATKQPWFPQWKAALPIGGEDGSLTSRFPDPPLKDHVFAKTGTLGETRALSGYLDTRSGKQVIFSVLVDDHAPTGSNDREIMDKIVASIAANN